MYLIAANLPPLRKLLADFDVTFQIPRWLSSPHRPGKEAKQAPSAPEPGQMAVMSILISPTEVKAIQSSQMIPGFVEDLEKTRPVDML